MLVNIVSVHGVYSKGDDLAVLCDQIAGIIDLPPKQVKVSVINYGMLLLTLERIPYVRNLIAMVIANRLAACSYKYPNAKTIVVAHSFGTWAVCESLSQWHNEFRLDCLILFGSVVSKNFKFDKYDDLEVYNFVGKKDMVVLASALWGTGWSGIFVFKKDEPIQVQEMEGYQSFSTPFLKVGEGNLSLPFVDGRYQARGYTPFGSDNLYPQTLNQMYFSSPLHGAIIDFKTNASVGGGYTFDEAKLTAKEVDLYAFGKKIGLKKTIKKVTKDLIIHGRVYFKLHLKNGHKFHRCHRGRT